MALKILLAIVIATGLGLTFVVSPNHFDAPAKTIRTPDKPANHYTRLQTVAASALGTREGAIVIINPQTGHVHAVVNPTLAFRSAFPPGSTIKSFTALAALRGGIVTQNTRLRCRGKHNREDVIDACSHPPNLEPFSPAEALAYSCNYYFATIGARLDEDNFARMLADFGFGQVTGIDAYDESPGVLADGTWQTESAIGEGAFLQVTPIQMAMAYAALLNGGQLLKPANDSVTRVRAQLHIDENERSVLLEGMRGAVTFGTAQKAELASLPAYVVGKTGTSTQLQGFRSQGWFVGLAFPGERQTGPEDAQLLVVVYLKKAHGAEAAEVARPIFEEFAGASNRGKDPIYVSVHQVSTNSTQRMSLDDYILRVVATEASVEDQPEALKALAIAARTYALKNLSRHEEQGYDFCSTTHCQRFTSMKTGIAIRPALVRAVTETTGLALHDDSDQIIDAYFSASCGGMTANLKSLWGEEAPTYLRGVRDEYCSSGAHYRWTGVIESQQLVNALRSDPRTDVGQRIRELSVVSYDQTGRAEVISIAGDRVRTISGWEFKLIVGRALGWNVLKSSRFNISRSGSQFVFSGSGFGHGLGLCQEGSHVMAQRGYSYQQILANYFPGTNVLEYSRKKAQNAQK
ncbi:MAG TPA: SpoIID/LytB domain-containing protein [Pyrinomonadaceae bacterium]